MTRFLVSFFLSVWLDCSYLINFMCILSNESLKVWFHRHYKKSELKKSNFWQFRENQCLKILDSVLQSTYLLPTLPTTTKSTFFLADILPHCVVHLFL